MADMVNDILREKIANGEIVLDPPAPVALPPAPGLDILRPTPAPYADVTVPTEPKAPKKFSQAFSEARAAGLKSFEWEGNTYHTQTKEETAAKPAPATKPETSSPSPTKPLGLETIMSQAGYAPLPATSIAKPLLVRDNPETVAKKARAAVPVPDLTPHKDFKAASIELLKKQDKAEREALFQAKVTEKMKADPGLAPETARAMVSQETVSGIPVNAPSMVDGSTPLVADPRSVGAQMSDYAKTYAKGSNSLLQGMGWLGHALTGADLFKDLEKQGESGVEYWANKQSDYITSTLKSFHDKERKAYIEQLFSQPELLGHMLAESAPLMAAGMVPSAAFLRGGMALAHHTVTKGLRARGAINAEFIEGAGVRAANAFRESLTAKLGIGTLGAVSEGLISSGLMGSELETFILKRPVDALRQDPEFTALEQRVGTDAARKEYAETVARVAAIKAGVLVAGAAGIGSPLEVRLLQRSGQGGVPSLARNAVHSGAVQGGEETVQTIGEEKIKYDAKVKVDPTQKFDPVKAGITGAVSGFAMGSAGGAIATGGAISAEAARKTAATLTNLLINGQRSNIDAALAAANLTADQRSKISKSLRSLPDQATQADIDRVQMEVRDIVSPPPAITPHNPAQGRATAETDAVLTEALREASNPAPEMEAAPGVAPMDADPAAGAQPSSSENPVEPGMTDQAPGGLETSDPSIVNTEGAPAGAALSEPGATVPAVQIPPGASFEEAIAVTSALQPGDAVQIGRNTARIVQREDRPGGATLIYTIDNDPREGTQYVATETPDGGGFKFALATHNGGAVVHKASAGAVPSPTPAAQGGAPRRTMADVEAALRNRTTQATGAQPSPVPNAQNTMPESEAAILEQINAMQDPSSGRDAVLITQGQVPSEVPTGAQRVYRVELGDGDVLLTTNMMKVILAKEAKAQGRDAVQAAKGVLSGVSEGPYPSEATSAAVARSPEGIETAAVALDPANPAAGIEAAQNLARDQDTVGIESTEQVIQQRGRDIQQEQVPNQTAETYAFDPVTGEPRQAPGGSATLFAIGGGGGNTSNTTINNTTVNAPQDTDTPRTRHEDNLAMPGVTPEELATAESVARGTVRSSTPRAHQGTLDRVAARHNSAPENVDTQVVYTEIDVLDLPSDTPHVTLDDAKNPTYNLDQRRAAGLKILLKELFGVETVFYTGTGPVGDGFAIQGSGAAPRVFLNARGSTVPQAQVIGHEFFHNVEDQGEEGVMDVYGAVVGGVRGGDEGLRVYASNNQYKDNEAVSEISADLSGQFLSPLFQTSVWDQTFAGVRDLHGAKKGRKIIKNFARALGDKRRELQARVAGSRIGYTTDEILSQSGLDSAFQAIGQAVRNYTPGPVGELDAAQARRDMGVKSSTAKRPQGVTFEVTRDDADEGTFVIARSQSEKGRNGTPLVVGHIHVPDEAVRNGQFDIGDIEVSDALRRQGIASAMLDRMSQALGAKPTGAMSVFTDDGRAFFDAYQRGSTTLKAGEPDVSNLLNPERADTQRPQDNPWEGYFYGEDGVRRERGRRRGYPITRAEADKLRSIGDRVFRFAHYDQPGTEGWYLASDAPRAAFTQRDYNGNPIATPAQLELIDQIVRRGGVVTPERKAMKSVETVQARKSTRKLPATITIDGVERPTTNSNGQPIHPTEEGVRNFWKWFGYSQVVDDQGRPLVVYHGTGADITEFKKPSAGKKTSHYLDFGFHFGTTEVADTYATIAQYGGRLQIDMSRDGQKGDPVIYPVYLSAQNIADITSGNPLPEDVKGVFLALAEDNGMSSRSKYVQLIDVDPINFLAVLQRKAGRKAIKSVFESAGYDGIKYSFYGDSYVVFKPTQIKSAIGNQGTFDGANPDIRKSTRKLPDTITVDGVERPTTNSNGQPIHPTEEGVRNFWKWANGNTLVSIGDTHVYKAGEPVVVQVVHGTTGDFAEFKRQFANIESDLGGGFYFTNTRDDVGENYAGLGPDLTQKIELEAERIESQSDGEIEMGEARRQARAMFMANDGFTMPVFVRFDNPVVLGGKGETFLSYEEAYDKETDEYGELEGDLIKLVEGLREVGSEDRYGDADVEQAIGDLMERAMDNGGLKASEVIEVLSSSEGLRYAADYENDGKLASKEIIRQAFAEAGFDGFIDQTVNKKFGSEKRVGKPMDGMDENTVHFIAFKPTQIKSAIGNQGTFDGANPDIRKSTRKIRESKETLDKYGLKSGMKHKTRDIAVALEARQRAKYGSIALDDRSPEAATRIAKWMVDEILFEMEHSEESGVGWYSEKYQAALDELGNLFPELKQDQTARAIMTAIVAITSDGQNVLPNFKQAIDIYGRFRKGGVTEGQFTTGRGHARQESILNNMSVLQRLYDTMGPVRMTEYLLQEDTVSRLKKLAVANGGDLKSDYQAHIRLPMAAVELGPKLGAFFANLMGASGYLTMDRWWSRSFNRYRGNLLEAPTRDGLDRFKTLMGHPEWSDQDALLHTVAPRESYAAKEFKDGTEIEKAANTLYKAAFENLRDAPENATDRTFMLDTVARAQRQLKRKGYNISVADIQAILWYYEKRLYGELGAKKSADISYKEAARRAIADYVAGELDSAIRPDAQDVDGEPGVEGEDRGSVEGGLPGEGSLQGQVKSSTRRFFSPLARAIQAARQDSQPAQQWRLWLQANKAKLGLKDDEIQWSGITDYLDAQGKRKVSKEEIGEYLRQGGVQVEEVVLGAQKSLSDLNDADRQRVRAIMKANDDLGFDLTRDAVDAYLEAPENYDVSPDDRAELNLLLGADKGYGKTKHASGNLVLPGGTDHREIVLTIPTIEPYNESDTTHYGDTGKGKAIAWMRINTRTDANGKKVLFVEEIQSQRNQHGRKKGFDTEKVVRPRKLNPGDSGYADGYRYSVMDVEIGDETFWNTLQEAEVAANLPGNAEFNSGVPTAPFVSTKDGKPTDAYIGLALKRLVAYAVETGHDSIAWTTGDQQADRYDLSKTLSSVTYHSPEKVVEGIDLNGDLAIEKNGIEPQDLESVVGKEIAENLLQQIQNGNDRPTVEGDGLKVGGGWTQTMYGDATGRNAQGKPSMIAQAAAKLGAQVGGVQMREKFTVENIKGEWRVLEDGKPYGPPLANEDAAQRVADSRNGAESGFQQPGFPITDKMREQAGTEGFPLFSKRKTPDQLRQSFADMVGQGNEAVTSFVVGKLETMEEEFVEAKRDVVSITETEARGRRLAEMLGWSTEAVEELLRAGTLDMGNGQSAQAADLLAAGAVASQLAVAQLLDNPGSKTFAQDLTSTLNLMISTRAHLSEIGRALNYAGWIQRRAGMSTEEQKRLAEKAIARAKAMAENLVGVSDGLTPDQKQQADTYNRILKEMAAATQEKEAADEAMAGLAGDVAGALDKLLQARQARNAAKKQVVDAQRTVRDAERKAAAARAKTPADDVIGAAERDAVRAEGELDAARAKRKQAEQDLRDAQRRIEAAKAKLDAENAKPRPAGLDTVKLQGEARRLEAELNQARRDHEAAKALKKLRDEEMQKAQDRVDRANAAAAKAIKDTPTPREIQQARAAARAAEQAALKALIDKREAFAELRKARAKLKAAVDRATGATTAAAKARQAAAALRKPVFVGKAGVSMDEIVAYLGGEKGLAKMQDALKVYGTNTDVDHLHRFMQGVANNIYRVKKEAERHRGVHGAVHRGLSMVLEQFRAFILTGIFTHGVNLASNLTFGVIEQLLTRPIKEALPGGRGAGRHYANLGMAAARAVADVLPVIRFGMTDEFPAAHFSAFLRMNKDLQTTAMDLGSNKWMDSHGGALPGSYGKWVRAVGFSPLGTADLAFKLVPYRLSIAMQKASGKPVDYAEAVAEAEYQTFQNKLSDTMGGLQAFLNGHPTFGFIVPFFRTLVNLINRTFDYTPVLSQARNIDQYTSGDAAARNLAVAQALVGAVLSAVAIALHGSGDGEDDSMLSGMGPLDPDQKAAWLANNQPMGLTLENWIIPLWRIEPFAGAMGLSIAAADAWRAYGQEPSLEAFAPVGGALVNTLIGKSFMSGVEDLFLGFHSLVTRGDASYLTEKLPQSIVLGALVPNALAQAGDITDPWKREAKGWEENFMRKIPGLRENLERKLDYKGQPIAEARYGTILPIQRIPRPEDRVAALLYALNEPLYAQPGAIKDGIQELKEALVEMGVPRAAATRAAEALRGEPLVERHEALQGVLNDASLGLILDDEELRDEVKDAKSMQTKDWRENLRAEINALREAKGLPPKQFEELK